MALADSYTLNAKHTREATEPACTHNPPTVKPMLEKQLDDAMAQAQQVDEEIQQLYSRQKNLLNLIRQLKVSLEDKCAQANEVLSKLEDKDLERY